MENQNLETKDSMLRMKICTKVVRKAKQGVEKPEARLLLGLQWVVGDSSNQPSRRRERRPRPVAPKSGGSTGSRPPKQRLSLPKTYETIIVKLEINLVELKLPQHGTKACIQITKWVCESQDTMVGSWLEDWLELQPSHQLDQWLACNSSVPHSQLHGRI